MLLPGDRSRILKEVLLGMSLLVAASVASLSGFFLYRHRAAFQDQLRLRAQSLASSLAEQSQFALLMDNQADLDRLARAVATGDRDVTYVVVEDASGRPVATASARPPDGARSAVPDSIEASATVVPRAEGGPFGLPSTPAEPLGRVRVGLSLRPQEALFQSALRQVCAIALLILVVACVFGFLHFRRLLQPLVDLASASRRVGEGDYEGPLPVKHRDDEIGDLVDGFNEMVGQVAQRTRELSEQVEARQRALAELAETQQRLIDLSRRSGMAEIATSVLHNVGNVLNSVNVSATIAAGKLRESRVGNLLALNTMLQDHASDLNSFLRDDPKGQRVLPYLDTLSRHFQSEREIVMAELTQLTGHIGHIKQIVTTQHAYARVSGISEEFSLAELAEDGIRMLVAGFERHQIDLQQELESIPPLTSDKHRILQILLNLLRNARQAVDQQDPPQRVIRVSLQRHGEDRVRLAVRDNGIGLTEEHLTRIFAHGFTTKENGHGFGLHSCAIAAKQLGGSLWAESEGAGRGATFTLELPTAAVATVPSAAT